jgi:hypothetical protein
MHRKKFAAVLCTSLLVFGCSDAEKSASPVGPSTRPASNAAASADTAAERAALQQLTRAVALALQDQGLRQRIKADMRQSRFSHEHKLQFSNYVHGASGGILLAKMAKETGKSREELLALLGQVRPLEFYMPVRAQRERWRGGEDLLVGSLIHDHEAPAVYTLRGERVRMRGDEVPTIPAMALVPVEANFSRPLDARYQNLGDEGGETIGTYMIEQCEIQPYGVGEPGDATTNCGGGGDGGGYTGGGTYTDPWASRATGVYVTTLNIDGDHEGAFKGDPEFEIHLQAPVGNPSVAEDIRCAGNESPDYRSRFNYDNNGSNYSGAILVADSAQMARFQATYGTSVGMNFIFWEDDDTACAIKADQARFSNMMSTIANNYGTVFAAIQNFDVKTLVKALPGIRDIVMAVASWIKSNDDVVGSAVEMSCSRDYTTFNYAIKDGTTTTGCVRLRAHDQAAY